MAKNPVIAATAGTILEWAEYTYYGYLAHFIATLFFPSEDRTVALIATFGVFAAGFLMRPIGGIVFGLIGDKHGRKKALGLSILLMGVATIGMGLVPTYAQIGIAAPIVLLIFRLIQGLAVAGEFNGAAIFLIEHATSSKGNKGYLAGAWVGAAAAAGMLLGAFSAQIVRLPIMPEWAWRIPFMIGFLGCGIAYIIRKNLDETPHFKAIRAKQTPFFNVIKTQLQGLLQVAAFAGFIAVWVYLGNLYFKAFLIHHAGIATSTAGWLTTFGQALVVILYPLVGLYADKTGGHRLIKAGLILAIVSAPSLYLLALTSNLILIVLAQIVYAIVNALVGAPMFRYLFDQFTTEVRYTGTAFSWSISAAVLGGTAPALATWFIAATEVKAAPGVYVSIIAMLSLWLFISHNKIKNAL